MKRAVLFSLYSLSLLLLLRVMSCKKNAYYNDTGTIDPTYRGTILQYLEQNPYHQFDSLVRIIRLAGMETVFQSESVTFFAPPDPTIINSIRLLNTVLLNQGRDTITSLAQLHPDFLKQQLAQYLFKGEHRLKDYPQVDPVDFRVYGGQYYSSYLGKVMLIGVQFGDAGGVRYAGYRRLTIGYFGETPQPGVSPPLYYVATSDVKPSNGIVHVLNYSDASFFGFDPINFTANAINFGFDYTRH